MRAAICLCLVAAAACVAGDEPVNEFQDLDKEITKQDDSWLSLETWNHIRVAMFIDHIAPEFEQYGCTFSGEKWKEKSILGLYLKTKLHDHLPKESLEKMGLGKNNKEKYTILGFPEDSDLRKTAIKAFKARVDREAMRRSDHAFRLKLASKPKKDPREKARKKLKLEEGEIPSEETVRGYSLRKLGHFIEYMGADPTLAGKEKDDLLSKALELLHEKTKPQDEL